MKTHKGYFSVATLEAHLKSYQDKILKDRKDTHFSILISSREGIREWDGGREKPPFLQLLSVSLKVLKKI